MGEKGPTAAAIGVGLIGGGFIGRSLALALRAAPALFDLPRPPRLVAFADLDAATRANFERRFGFARSAEDWRAVVDDPEVDLVVVAAPNALHMEMALAALAAGKHVFCEKPLALNAADAETMALAAESAGRVNMVGYNYVLNPTIAHARALIAAGVIGDVVQFRGVNDEDYMADPAKPISWRCLKAQGGSGTLGDLGSHLVHMALWLVGPIAELSADLRAVIRRRPLAGGGGMGAVENEDLANLLVRFESDALGVLGSSRVTWGRKNRLAFEVAGTRGTLAFDQERMNELRLYEAGAAPGRDGFRTLLAGPDFPGYAPFIPAPGHQLGFNDTKTLEIRELLTAIGEGRPAAPDFRDGWRVERVMDAIARSADTRRWEAP